MERVAAVEPIEVDDQPEPIDATDAIAATVVVRRTTAAAPAHKKPLKSAATVWTECWRHTEPVENHQTIVCIQGKYHFDCMINNIFCLFQATR